MFWRKTIWPKIGVLVLAALTLSLFFQNCGISNPLDKDNSNPGPAAVSAGQPSEAVESLMLVKNLTLLLQNVFKNGGYLTDISQDGKKILIVSKALEMGASNVGIGTDVIVEVLVEDLTIVKKIPFPRSLISSFVRYSFDSSSIIVVGTLSNNYPITAITVKNGQRISGANLGCRELIVGTASSQIACFTFERKIRIFDISQNPISEISMTPELGSYLIGLGYTELAASGFSFLQNDTAFAFLGWHGPPTGCSAFSLDLLTSQLTSFPIPNYQSNPDLGSTFCKLSFSETGRYFVRVSKNTTWADGYYSPNLTNIFLFDLSSGSTPRLVSKVGNVAGNGNSSEAKFANERLFFLTEATNLGAVGLTLVYADIVGDKPIVPTISNIIGSYLVSKNGLTASASTKSGWILWNAQH